MAKLSSTQIFGNLVVDGEIINKATTTTEGVVQLNDATNSTSTTQAATANAVKKAYDLAAGKAASSHTHNYAGSSSAGGAATSALACTGNSATATKLQTARTLTVGNTGKTFDGSGNVSWSLSEIGAAPTSHGTHVTYSSTVPAAPGTASAGTASTVARTDHVHPAQTSVSGNAGTATKLQTARTLTVGNTGKTFDGSGNVSWSLSEIGALSTTGKAADSDKLDGIDSTGFGRAYSGSVNFGGNQNGITTAQFITLITNLGAFNTCYWVARGSWSYASNQIINDTGCGNIHLAGSVVEVIGNKSTYTIRITTPTTSSGGATNTEFIYINNGSTYNPGWRRIYNMTVNSSGDIYLEY